MDPTAWITSTMELPVALLSLTQTLMTPVTSQSVFFHSTFRGEAHEYQVPYMPIGNDTVYGCSRLQKHSLVTTDLPAGSMEDGKGAFPVA